MAVAVKKAPSGRDARRRRRPLTRQAHFVQGALRVEGEEVWQTYRCYNADSPNTPPDASARGCADHLERLARTGNYPGEVLPTRMRVVTLTDLLEEGPDALYVAVTDLIEKSCREHVIRINGRGQKTKFA